jgi:UDP-glucose-4-epimerase GalE
MRTAFVTGGAGYLGSHLAKALKQAGYYTFCFDLKLPENRKYWDNQTIGDVRVEHDLYDSFEYLQRVHNIKPDVVFHLAGLIEVGLSVENPIDFWQTNVGGTCNLLTIMKEFNVNNIVYSSTAGLYSPQFTTLSEKAEVGNNNPYANSKYAAECAIRDSKVNHIIFRFFNLAGADPDGEMGEMHDPETHLIPLMFESLNNKEEFIVNGNDYNTPDGTCIRDFVHVSDVADAHVLADNYLQTKYDNQPTLFNLGIGKGYSILQVINTAKSELQLDIDYKFGKRREGDPSKLVANIDSAKEYLKFKPKHNLKSILRTAYNWYERQRDRSTI